MATERNILEEVKARLASGESGEQIMAGMSAAEWEAYRDAVTCGTGPRIREEFHTDDRDRAQDIARKVMRRHGLGRAWLVQYLDADHSEVGPFLAAPATPQQQQKHNGKRGEPLHYRCTLDVFPDEGLALLSIAAERRSRKCPLDRDPRSGMV